MQIDRGMEMVRLSQIMLPTGYYQNFHADMTRDIPAEGYGGWKKETLPLDIRSTALIVMHAWDYGSAEKYGGWYRAAEWLPRADEIDRTILPEVVKAARRAGMTVIHVASSESYCLKYPWYRKETAEESASLPQIKQGPVTKQLRGFQAKNGFPGEENAQDIARAFRNGSFHPCLVPEEGEEIVVSSQRLFQFCERCGIDHLIYTGSCINWCLLDSPGGMVQMSGYGMLCSAIRQAVTGVENRESARQEWGKEMALWKIAIGYGFVYDADDFIKALGEVT